MNENDTIEEDRKEQIDADNERRANKWETMVDECTSTMRWLKTGTPIQFRIDMAKIGLLAGIWIVLLFKL